MNFWKGLGIFFGGIIAIFLVMYMIPSSRAVINEYIFDIRSVDEETDYENRERVETLARTQVAAYDLNVRYYNDYMDYYEDETDATLKAQYLTDARIYKDRANAAATQYNEIMTENSFVWKGNIPDDLPASLPYIG
jgi:hypothetical protein